MFLKNVSKVFFWFLLVLWSWFLPFGWSYRLGDPIPLSRKTITNDKTEDWHEIISKLSPKFGFSTNLNLPYPVDTDNPQSPNQNIKMMFSIDEGKFLSPYFIMRDRNNFLQTLEFVFLYSGDSLVNVKYNLKYSDDHSQPPASLEIVYVWENFAEQDTTLGLGALLVLGFILTMVMLVYSLVDSQILTSDASLALGASGTVISPFFAPFIVPKLGTERQSHDD